MAAHPNGVSRWSAIISAGLALLGFLFWQLEKLDTRLQREMRDLDSTIEARAALNAARIDGLDRRVRFFEEQAMESRPK
jgi:hypothetical protein